LQYLSAFIGPYNFNVNWSVVLSVFFRRDRSWIITQYGVDYNGWVYALGGIWEMIVKVSQFIYLKSHDRLFNPILENVLENLNYK